ncbi:MAG: hypothetical protein VXZ96_06315, partial [Myxococcota bacterium]|nr:hypothetical protein [Myxococcota bacterium]
DKNPFYDRPRDHQYHLVPIQHGNDAAGHFGHAGGTTYSQADTPKDFLNIDLVLYRFGCHQTFAWLV